MGVGVGLGVGAGLGVGVGDGDGAGFGAEHESWKSVGRLFVKLVPTGIPANPSVVISSFQVIQKYPDKPHEHPHEFLTIHYPSPCSDVPQPTISTA